MPCATPPWICPSTIAGLTTVPQSWWTTYRRISRSPVAMSTSPNAASEPGGELHGLIPDLSRGDADGVAARDERPTREGAGAPVELARVTGHDRHVAGVAADRLGGDLGERRLVALALARETGGDKDFAA